jgi:hypothetical protein
MSTIAPTEPRRLRRKKPEVPSPLYKPKGHRRTIKGVARIYLEDIERAYDVMVDFLPFSPSAQRDEKSYERSLAHNEMLAAIYRKHGDEEGLAELVPPEVPRPIEIETSEYEPAYSLEELTSIPEKRSAALTMSIGYGDLRLRCTAKDCDVSTNEESPEAFTAYRQLVAIIEPRVNRLAAILLSGRTLGFSFAMIMISLIINTFAKIAVFILLPFLLTIIFLIETVWQLSIWDRRTGVAILLYRHEAPTFWEENWWGIAKGIVITVGSAILIAIALRVMTGAWPDSAP